MYNLIWQDDFDGASLDLTKWTPADAAHDPDVSSWMLPANVSVSNSNLVLTAKVEAHNNHPYTCGSVTTGVAYWKGQNKMSFTYGRIEIKAKIPTGKGFWPAIWLYPYGENYGLWPLSGELDILEMLGTKPFDAQQNIHYGLPHTSDSTKYTMPTDCTNWHVYALERRPNRIDWFIDDVLVKTETQWFTTAPNAPYPAPFDIPFSLLIEFIIGGTWQGEPDASTVFPNQMLVDYVKVYEDDMDIPTGLQNLMTEINAEMVTQQAQSDDEAGKVSAATVAKAAADAALSKLGQLKAKCQEMIDLLG